jgi:hypothetical protein
MKRNSTTIYIESPSGDPNAPCITPIPWLNNAPDFNGITEPTLSVLRASYERNKDNIIVIPDPVPQPVIPQPDPKGFYEKLIGVTGDNSLFQVYQSISQTALDPTTETSSLAYAVTIFNGALNNNDWAKDYAKPAYAQAYTILKQFLTVGQIEVVDQANIDFKLV